MLIMVRLLEAAASAYCERRGWAPPPPVPPTRKEREWIAEHGEPALPAWAYVLEDFAPARPPAPDRAQAFLAGRAIAEVNDVAIEAILNDVAALPQREAAAVIGGFYVLVASLGTSALWDAAGRALGWDTAASDDSFLDARCYAVIVDPVGAGTTSPEWLTRVLERCGDEEEIGCSGGLVDLLSEVAELRDVDLSDLPDVWLVR